MSNAEHILRREAKAAARMVEHLNLAGMADDGELVISTIEGETYLVEAIASVVAMIDECDIHEAGLEAMEKAFAARRAAIVKRRERLRAAIEVAMVEAEQSSIKLDSRTVYLSKVAPAVVIDAEADIPSRFWKQPPAPAPKLDKQALKDALNAEEAVPGARLDNGGVRLNMRT